MAGAAEIGKRDPLLVLDHPSGDLLAVVPRLPFLLRRQFHLVNVVPRRRHRNPTVRVAAARNPIPDFLYPGKKKY